MGWGHVNGILPYTILDNYNRVKKPREWKAAVLENECLRATFLPELGGRLWSLIDKQAGRELLCRNRCSSPAIWACATRGSPAVWSGTWA